MGSTTSLPSLGLLQAVFTQAVAGLEAEASRSALEGLRQVPGFDALSDLNEIVAPESLARMVLNPVLFDDAARALSALKDLPALKETLSLPRLEHRLKLSAQLFDLRHGAQIYLTALGQAPYESQAEAQADRALEGALELYDVAASELEAIGKTMSRVLKDELNWPGELNLETLGSFAVSIRRAFDARSDHLNAEQRYDLMRLAACLNTLSCRICAYDEDKAGFRMGPVQAKKIGVLIEVIFGCGFGNDDWLTVSSGFRRLSKKWNWKNLKKLTGEAVQVFAEVRDESQSLFRPPVSLTPRDSAIYPFMSYLAPLYAGSP